MNDKELEKLREETNEKFIGRVQHMIYGICGCEPERAEKILKECLKRNEERKGSWMKKDLA